MPTSCDPPSRLMPSRPLLVSLCLVFVSVGCQSTRLAKVPGMGWLASDDPPPLLESADSATSYPPPSAVATPTALSDTSGGATNAMGSNTSAGTTAAAPASPYTGASYQLAQTNPPAAAVPRTMPAALGVQTGMTSPPTSGNAVASNALPTATPASTLPASTNPATRTAPPSSASAANELPIGLPPGVTAPNLSSFANAAAGNTAPPNSSFSSGAQQGPYAMLGAASGSTPPPSSALAAAANTSSPTARPRGGGVVAAADLSSSYPTTDSGSATTWDYPVAGTAAPQQKNLAANSSGGDFEAGNLPVTNYPSAGATPEGSGNVQPIAAVAGDNSAPGNSAATTYNAATSHYESIAEESFQTAAHSWRPGSTTNYAPSVAAAAAPSGYGAGVQAIPTAQLPPVDSHASGWE